MTVTDRFRCMAALQKDALNASNGSAASVRGYRMQPLDPELVAIVGRHVRTSAVVITDFVGGVGEGQVPR